MGKFHEKGNYVKTPTIFQMENTECGAASLAMIFAYFGREMPLELMRVETGVSRDGCKMGNIMRCAKRYGLECHGYSIKTEKLYTIQTPCIIHWQFVHFVVFEGFKGKHAYINDPAVGRRKISFEELDNSFTGIVLTFASTDKFKKEKLGKKGNAFLKQRVSGYWGVLFKIFYVGVLLVFPSLVLPVLSQVFMDDILMGGYYDWLVKLLTFMGACALLKFGLNWYRDLILQKLSCILNLESGSRFLIHMFRLPMVFFDQRNPGDLVNRMENNTQINDFLAEELVELVLNSFMTIFYLIVLCFYSPALTCIGIADFFISVLVIYFANRSIASVNMRMQIARGKTYSVMCAGYGISDTIKATSTENGYISKVLGCRSKQVNDIQRLYRFQKIIGTIPEATGKLADVLILLVGGILIINGKMTIGMLTAYNSLFDSFCDPVNKIVVFIQKIQNMKANIGRVNDIESYKEDRSYTVKEKNPKLVFNGKVELRDISFGYSKVKEPLLKDFSFNLKPGESIAFVGPSGCGKSTISKIASGLYHPWTGCVLLDDIPIEELKKEVFNSAVATVSQDINLFSGTIRDNLTMWKTDMLEEMLDDATKCACIYDDIMALGGYDATLTEGATNLSGGQRQRLEIARAIASRPAVLVMDEATSALDTKTEEKILKNIRSLGCTCIIVAHRLSAIRDCSQIVVMRQGAIVECGTHQSLLEKKGYYSKLVANM